MDKTKLEHDLETAETQKKFKITNIVLLLILGLMIISIYLMMNMRSTLSLHEDRINSLEKKITSLHDDLKKMKTDEEDKSR